MRYADTVQFPTLLDPRICIECGKRHRKGSNPYLAHKVSEQPHVRRAMADAQKFLRSIQDPLKMIKFTRRLPDNVRK